LAKKKTPTGASPKKPRKTEVKPIPQSPSRTTRGTPTPTKKAQRRKLAEKREIPWFIIGVITFIILVMAFLIFYRIVSGSQAQAAALAPEISLQEAHQKYLAGALFLDVREQEEWDEFHVPDTTLIPLGELDQRLAEVPRDKEIVVICRNGNRSKEGRDILLNAGFSRVTSMAGGVSQWEVLGFPITRNIK
jgi:rhodanese-related sulfurtransferase